MAEKPNQSKAVNLDPDPSRINAEQETVHHEPSGRKRKGHAKVGQLNLTSMMDVTFQLLIFFVLTANFAVTEGVLQADLPAGTTGKAESEVPKTPVKIHLQQAAMGDKESVLIGIEGAGQFTDFGEAYEALRAMHQDVQGGHLAEDNPIIIRPRREVLWSHVVNIFNACRRAKYTNVSFAPA